MLPVKIGSRYLPAFYQCFQGDFQVSTTDQTTISDLLRRVTEGQESILELSKDGDLKRIAFGQRKLQPELPTPTRQESPPRAHVFHTADSLIAYAEKYGDCDTVILLDVPSMNGCVVLSDVADQQFELLPFQPTQHPLFVEWSKMLGRRIDVLQFAEFIMGHRRQIVSPDGREAAMIFSQLQASTKMTVARGQGKAAINGIMIETKIQGKAGEAFVELPESLTVRLPLFVGEPEQDIEIDLLIGSQDTSIWVSASAAGVLDAQLQAFTAMADKIRDGLPEMTVGLGRVAHGAWKYIQA